jgi:hypothetical protein
MFLGEASSRNPALDVYLAIDRVDVCPHRIGAEEKSLRYLLVRKPLRQQAKDFHFAAAEIVRVISP